MAFEDILFPNPKLIHGLKRRFDWPCQIVSNGSSEYRITKQDSPRKIWIWQARSLSSIELREIYDFLIARKMATNSFRFLCPFDKIEYHVRLYQTNIEETAEYLDINNNIVYENMSDISLIEVFE